MKPSLPNVKLGHSPFKHGKGNLLYLVISFLKYHTE